MPSTSCLPTTSRPPSAPWSLQHAIAAIDLRALEVTDEIALRIGVHVGPVFPLDEPVLKAQAFTG